MNFNKLKVTLTALFMTLIFSFNIILPSNSIPTYATSKKSAVMHVSKAKKEIIVYITRTGSKYHRAGCRYLNRSCIPVSLSDAMKYYTPCSVCNPPQ